MHQILTVSKTKGVYWDNDMIVPEGRMIYNSETRTVYKGNGLDFLEDLEPYLDLTLTEDIATFYNTIFPQLVPEDADGILLTDVSGSFSASDLMRTEDIITKEDLLSTLEFYADNVHEHGYIDIIDFGTAVTRAIGLKPNEIPVLNSRGQLDESVIPPNVSLNDKDSDIISFLLLGRMSKTDMVGLEMPRGIVDEFVDMSNIDIYNSGEYRWDNQAIYKDGPNFSIVSKPYTKNENNSIYIYFRGSVLNGSMNKDIMIEVSRGSQYWSQVILNKLPMVKSTIECFSGVVDLGEIRKQEVIPFKGNCDLENVKGNISTFAVDTINNSGHFDLPVNVNIKTGYTIHTPNEGKVVITNIDGDGTGTDSVSFDGILPDGVYTDIVISPCTFSSENGLTLSGINNGTTIDLVPEFASAKLDLLDYKWKHFFHNIINGTTDGISYQLLFGYQDNTYARYDTTHQLWIDEIRKESNQWEYFDHNTNNWVTHIDNINRVVSRAYTHGAATGNTLDELSLIPIIREDKQLTSIMVTMSANGVTPTELNGLTDIDIDGISDTGEVSDNSELRWRCKTSEIGDVVLHGIRIRY